MVGIVEQYVLDQKDFLIIASLLDEFASRVERSLNRELQEHPLADFSHINKKLAIIRRYAYRVRTLS